MKGFIFLLVAIVSVTAYAVPKHIIFAFVDHFEPENDSFSETEVTMWVDDYIAMANHHHDADGRNPIHTYFLWSKPPMNPANLHSALTKLNEATYKCFGEVEFHCHHGVEDEGTRTEEQATEKFIEQINFTLDNFSKHGALITAEIQPKQTFAFIHGMWALDNSRYNNWSDPNSPHYEYCGVNQEITILKQYNTYADFTFPAWGPMEPPIYDSIFYVADDNLPASYKRAANRRLVEVNQPPFGDLMIIEGPKTSTAIGAVPGQYYFYPSIWRMDSWVSHNVHVVGRDDWIFVKVYAHGCDGYVGYPDTWNCFFGPVMDKFYNDIEAKYNDGVNWKLHYVSAREMYNIIKAAEAGMTGDPGSYRDFVIGQYANMLILTTNQYKLISYDQKEVILEVLDNPAEVSFSLKDFCLCDMIFESSEPNGPWEACDAVKSLGEFMELSFTDITAHRFYRIVSPIQPQSSVPADIYIDCRVGFEDFGIFALCWLTSQADSLWNPLCDISEPADGIINFSDLAVFMSYWLQENP